MPARKAPSNADLSPRERDVLRLVVQQFVHTAVPVGSKALAEAAGLDLSSASIRNTMHALEERGFLAHPHTSAGRIPTEQGYRLYVDELMDVPGLPPAEAALLRAQVGEHPGDLDVIARETSRLLGRLTQLLGVVLSPRLSTGVLERLDVVPLSSTRVLIILTVRGGLARTVQAEVDGELPREHLDPVVQRLNERLAGLTLEEIRRTGAARVQDLAPEDRTGIVRLLLHDAPALFREATEQRAAVGGAQHLVAQPEFQQPEEVRSVIQLVEDENVVVHLLERPTRLDAPGRALVRIGGELGPALDAGRAYSVVTARYRYGGGEGAVGVVGPTRMDYGRAVALVEHVAALLTRGAEAA
ncbi:MAG TPA: heat-inducible transcriptional repressor HrcA [Rubricoccaceae bacterium]|nr:heat-inducible transcriptional repressor HrcA [Rubricoccaceae bacterium]